MLARNAIAGARAVLILRRITVWLKGLSAAYCKKEKARCSDRFVCTFGLFL